MSNPTKQEIEAVFSRLRSQPANKVNVYKFVIYFTHLNSAHSLALIAPRKLQHGHQLHTESSFASIVQQSIVALVFI